MRRFEGQTALITGSTHGIGLGIARRLRHEGASVVVNDQGAYDGEAIAEDLRAIDAPGDALYVEADVSNATAIRRLVDSAVSEYGQIDVLVNNVGVNSQGYLFDTDLDEWDSVFTASLRGAWLMTKYALPHMPEGSSIVNTSSTNAEMTVPSFFPYNVAKAGVDGLTRAMAVELGPLGITANAIQPGAILTDNPDEEELDQNPEIDPLGRWGRPEDIAGVAAFLASDDAGYVTGVSIPVDAGRSVSLSGSQQADLAPEWSDI
ncbi:SDR family oxidoreductase [Halobaculum sp. WSA2]|uniref:SDR family oxidoreductase n=1 Tax=Halobaculum saliterrae TaxID=2073113 RepID=A0A6B0T1E6_9EURY|nr:SDR family NAD(P)-dependent oxidoreductase [Halobaculum saliterrae]MXR40419.1 SDR family oxidoreductase [Halobaculum saliterrae]